MTQLNDKLGKVDSYLPLAKVYQVTFDDGPSQAIPRANLQEVAAQPNLAKGTRVKMHSLQEPTWTQLNDKLGKIQSYLPLAKVYQVTLDDESSQFIPRANLREVAEVATQLIFAKGTSVKVHSIQEPSMTQLNDKLGKIHSYLPLAKVYQVTFDDGSSQAILPKANLREVQPAAATTTAT